MKPLNAFWRFCGRSPVGAVVYIWTGCIVASFIAYAIGGKCALLECPPHRTAAASLSVNPAVRHYYQNAPGVSTLCGLPAAPAVFSHGVVTQQYRGCQILGRYSVRSNIPTPTLAPIPSPTLPAPTLIPLPTSAPVPSPTPDCWSDYDRCLLSLIDQHRASIGVAPLTLNATQSACSLAHSVHMAAQGYISHDQFPADVCIPWTAVAENVGEAPGSEQAAIVLDLNQMMSEYTGSCAGVTSHACNILNPNLHQVGIGIDYTGGTLWLTEDFTN